MWIIIHFSSRVIEVCMYRCILKFITYIYIYNLSLTFHYIRLNVRSFEHCVLLPKISLSDKTKRLLMAVVSSTVHLKDRWKPNTLCARHKTVNYSIRCLNSQSCHLKTDNYVMTYSYIYNNIYLPIHCWILFFKLNAFLKVCLFLRKIVYTLSHERKVPFRACRLCHKSLPGRWSVARAWSLRTYHGGQRPVARRYCLRRLHIALK